MNSPNLNPKRIDALPPGVAVRITIDLMETGAMCISGPVYDRQWMVNALKHALDQVQAFHTPKPTGILTPNRDVDLMTPPPKEVAA